MESPTSPLSSLHEMTSQPALEIHDDKLTRRPARTNEEKLELVSQYMRNELRWGITEYLKAVMESSSTGGQSRRIAFTKFAYEDPKALQFYLGTDGSMTVNQRRSREHIMKHTKSGAASIREEIKKLAMTKPFHKSQMSDSGGFERMNISSIIEGLETTCPLFLSLLRTILQPLRSASAVDEEEDTTASQDYLIVTIIAIICRATRNIESSGFQLQLSIYLHSKGIKRRQLEALSQFGLCCSYRTTMRAIKKQNEESARCVAAQGKSPSIITAYDNFEQMEHVKEQRLDNQSSFVSVTTGQCIQGIEMPPGGLLQSMLNSSVELQLKDIFLSPGNQADTIENKARCCYYYFMINLLIQRIVDLKIFCLYFDPSCISRQCYYRRSSYNAYRR
jgi:hypothetical protein